MGATRLGLPVTLSALVHVGLVALVLFVARVEKPRGEIYAVNLVAAAPGPRQVGIVSEAPPKTEPPGAASQARRDAAEGRGAACEANASGTAAHDVARHAGA